MKYIGEDRREGNLRRTKFFFKKRVITSEGYDNHINPFITCTPEPIYTRHIPVALSAIQMVPSKMRYKTYICVAFLPFEWERENIGAVCEIETLYPCLDTIQTLGSGPPFLLWISSHQATQQRHALCV
jgi:hypothetical protein